MPFTAYTWPSVDLTIMGASLVLRVLANHGALMLPPLPEAEQPTYVRAMPMRAVLRAIVEETGWHVSEGLFYQDLVPWLTGTMRRKKRTDPLTYLARRFSWALLLGEGELVRIVYQRQERGQLNNNHIFAGTSLLFPPETLFVNQDGEMVSPFTTVWKGAMNRREPYLVLTPKGIRALTNLARTGAWVWKDRGERWEDLLPPGTELLWRVRHLPRRGRRSTAETLADELTRLFPAEDLTPEVREFLFGPADRPEMPISDPSKREKDPRMAASDSPLFYDAIQLLETTLSTAVPYLEAPLPSPEEIYEAYRQAREDRELPVYQRHPTGWAGTERIMEFLAAAWDETYGSPTLCGERFRERLKANWPSDFMAFKIMCRNPRFWLQPEGLVYGGMTALASPQVQAMLPRLHEIQEQYGGAWGDREEWPSRREELLRLWAPSVAAAAAVSLWSARRACAFMRTDARSDEVVALSQVAIMEHW